MSLLKFFVKGRSAPVARDRLRNQNAGEAGRQCPHGERAAGIADIQLRRLRRHLALNGRNPQGGHERKIAH